MSVMLERAKRRHIGNGCALLLFTLFIRMRSDASASTGKAVGVTNGDTITVMQLGKDEKIRLYGIDCPEKGQDFGQRAKIFTSDLVFGKVVEVDPVSKDR